jgi:F0F1-type ATP synthase beta subunit
VLTRELAQAGHYPAIDVLSSVSRLIGEIVPAEVEQAGQRLRAALAVMREKEDLVSIGAYQPGSDPALDTALAHRARIERFLRQPVRERSDPRQTDARLLELARSLAAELASVEGEIPDAEMVLDEPVSESPVVEGPVTGVLSTGPAGAGAVIDPDIAGGPAIPALGLSI